MACTPNELEFIAGQEEIEIIPKFDSANMWLITGDLGPFKTGVPIKVPIWMAIHLRSLDKCNIVAPEWMTKAKLEEVKAGEITSALFTKMPSEDYMVIAKIMFEHCPGDVPDADDVKVLVKDIWDCRLTKLRTAVLTFIDRGASWAKVDNLTPLEMCNIRPFFTQALEQVHRYKKVKLSLAPAPNPQSEQNGVGIKPVPLV